MKNLVIEHYVDKKIFTTCLQCATLKLEIRAKMIVLIDKDNVVFACKLTDFICLSY